MKKLTRYLLILLFLTIAYRPIYGQEMFLEIYLSTENTGGDTIRFTITKVSQAWAGEGTQLAKPYLLTSDYSGGTIEIIGDYALPADKPNSGIYGFNLVGSVDPDPGVQRVDYAFGNYKVEVGTKYFFIDYRDCDWTASIDIHIHYNGEAGGSFKIGENYANPDSLESVQNGSQLNIWNVLLNQTGQQLGCFEPSNPTNLNVVSSGGNPSNPVLTWTSSDPPYVDATVGGAKHDIWRKKTPGSYTKIEDNYIGVSYTDTDVLTGGSLTFYYKVRGRNGDDTISSAGYSNEGSIAGHFGAKITTPGINILTIYELKVSNYPNPFNPETSISIELPKETNVKLVVYDILGKQVAVLAEGRYSKGKHTLIWDGSKHASGFYYYTLTTEDEVAIGKMLLLK